MKILVVDDDPQILDALAVGLHLQWHDATVFTADNGESGLQAFREYDPDLVLLDVVVPDMSGFEVLQEIRQVSEAPVIVLTACGEEADQVRGLELGADDYVVKPFSHMVLIARIRAVLRRAKLAPPNRAAVEFVCGGLSIDFQKRRVTLQGDPVRLTGVEYAILYHLVRNAGQLLAHKALLKHVWGENYGATTDHLKVYISRLRAKVEPKDGPRFIETERGLGYRFVGTNESAGAAAESENLALAEQ